MTEPEDMQQLAGPLRTPVSIGMKIPTQWVYDKLQIPVPTAQEEVLAIQDNRGRQRRRSSRLGCPVRDWRHWQHIKQRREITMMPSRPGCRLRPPLCWRE